MTNAQRITAIDSRNVFRVYAVATGLAGIVLASYGPNWIEIPAEWVRIAGAMLMAASCASFAMVSVEDPEARRKAAGWYALAHGIVLATVALQLKPAGARWPVDLMAANLLIFYYFWRNQDKVFGGSSRPIVRLFARDEGVTERLRSRYEEQIRAAASQEERHRLARDLHDSVKQQLFVIQTAAATAQARFDADAGGAREAIEQVRTAAREAIGEMQAMLDQLRAAPLGNTGLVEAVKKQAEALGFRTGAQIHFEVGTLPPEGSMAPGEHDAISRIAQEALANVARHARARNVWITLDGSGGEFRVQIRDDGSGYDPNHARSGMGIANMRARAAEFGGMFEIGSRKSEGTWISVSMPYEVIPFVRYKRNAVVWGLVALAMAAVVYFKPGAANGWIVAMAAVECLRQATGYWRTRGPKETRV